jgi:hypothetical protein
MESRTHQYIIENKRFKSSKATQKWDNGTEKTEILKPWNTEFYRNKTIHFVNTLGKNSYGNDGDDITPTYYGTF